jgi:diguanylate cyclase (GGDEF)-like protein
MNDKGKDNMNENPTEGKPKVLLVDDTKTNILILTNALAADCEIIAATSGKEALELAAAETPDLILLDILMPEMDGYAVCRELKSNPLTKPIPVIFITAMGEEENEAKGLEIGAIDYITKPFNPLIVKVRVKNHLDLKKYRDYLEHLSMIDGLTGIHNRRHFNEYFDREWRRAVRYKTPISVAIMDIDFFKLFNDHYGHMAGDDCLRRIAQALKSSIRRPGDQVFRYGGEEFICVLPNTDTDGAMTVSENIRKSVAELKISHDRSRVSPYITLSIGVSTIIPLNDTSHGMLIEQADKLLYKAKQAGRNQIRVMNM